MVNNYVKDTLALKSRTSALILQKFRESCY